MIHINIIGFLVYVHIPKEKRTKLDPFRNKGIFFGYNEVSKSFRIYISGFHCIYISRDVTFDEQTTLKNPKGVSLKKYMKMMYLPEK